MRHIALSLFFVLIAGCANPVNKVTSQNYADTCAEAERNDRLTVAEDACYRALVNVDIGNLGAELKSTRLYDFARVKRRLGKFSEAETLLNQSIDLAKEVGTFSPEAMGRRYIELAVNLAAQNRWTDGFVFLDQAIPVIGTYTDKERDFSTMVLSKYADALDKAGQTQAAAKCRTAAQVQ